MNWREYYSVVLIHFRIVGSPTWKIVLATSETPFFLFESCEKIKMIGTGPGPWVCNPCGLHRAPSFEGLSEELHGVIDSSSVGWGRMIVCCDPCGLIYWRRKWTPWPARGPTGRRRINQGPGDLAGANWGGAPAEGAVQPPGQFIIRWHFYYWEHDNFIIVDIVFYYKEDCNF